MKKTFLRTLLAGGILTLCYGALRGGFAAGSLTRALFIWSDGFAMMGVLLVLSAGAIALNRKGFLDIFSYALFQAGFLLLRKKSEEYVNYHDFKLLKNRSTYPLLPVVLTGSAFMAIGGILTWLYYRSMASAL